MHLQNKQQHVYMTHVHKQNNLLKIILWPWEYYEPVKIEEGAASSSLPNIQILI